MKWHVAAMMFLGVQLVFVTSLALGLGFNQPPPLIKYAQSAAGLVGLVWGCAALWRLRARPANPLKFLLAEDWTQQRNFAGAMALVWLQFVLLTWAKAMLPLMYSTMWADPLLADLEAALLGSDAWRLLPGPNPVLDFIYFLWSPTIGVMFAWLFFVKNERREAVLLSFFLTVGLLGTFGQYLLPSGGPVFYDRLGFGDRFAEMVLTGHTPLAVNHLWAAYSGNYISYATGISAFPSIHVATAAWVALSFRHWAAYLYLAVIFFGSIILGWHYAIDGIAGIAGAVGCYLLAGRLLSLIRRPPTELATEAA